MSVISIFSACFCHDDHVVRKILDRTGYPLITDDLVVSRAAELSGLKKNRLRNAFGSKTSVFNPFTHEKESAISYLKLALALMLDTPEKIICGNSGLLIPQTLYPALRICLTADPSYRGTKGAQAAVSPVEDILTHIQIDDHDKTAWAACVLSAANPWQSDWYHLILPMDKLGPDKAADLILIHLAREKSAHEDTLKTGIPDFLLAARTEVALVNAGHNVAVQASKGAVCLQIDKQVLMLGRLEDELKTIAETVSGVYRVETRIGKPGPPAPVYRKNDAAMPSKVLLVDDEKEFVQTLSERLQMRGMGSVVAHDGQSALNLVQNDAPDVMIIDLKMPGMDGMEILQKVKQIRPGIEIIVLTGHGSEKDRMQCLTLGAFAYLQKPADINLLSDTLKQAHKKAKTAF